MVGDGSEYIKTQVMGRGVVVAIDGPSGSGKSTVARNLAAEMDVEYLDTGAMYRALCWWLLENNIDLSDSLAVEVELQRFPLVVEPFAYAPRFLVGGVNVTRKIREEAVTRAVSDVAANLKVRAEMIHRQREIIDGAKSSGRGIVVEGRDITTVVAPNADVRVLLTASEQVRMRRRATEQNLDERSAAEQVLGRDAKDSGVTHFLEPAEGVEVIDSSELTVNQVKDQIVEMVRVALGIAS